MRIALIVTENHSQRDAHLIALELDERLQELGQETRIIDASNASIVTESIIGFEAFILIGFHNGPLYNVATHHLLTSYKELFRGKRMATVMISSDPILASFADVSLKRLLKILGASTYQQQLLVSNPSQKFDVTLRLTDQVMDREISRFVNGFVIKESMVSSLNA